MPSSFSFNPQTWKYLNPQDPKALSRFLQELGDTVLQMQNLLTQLQSAPFVAGVLNGGGQVQESALTSVQLNSGIQGSQTLECLGATAITATLQANTVVSPTLTLNHVSLGTFIQVRFINFVTTAAQTFFLAATRADGTTVPTYLFNPTLSVALNTTGISVAANTQTLMTGTLHDNGELFMMQ